MPSSAAARVNPSGSMSLDISAQTKKPPSGRCHRRWGAQYSSRAEKHRVALAPVQREHGLQVGAQTPRGEPLGEGTGQPRTHAHVVPHRGHCGDRIGVTDGPSYAEPRRDDFAERPQLDGQALGVDGQEGRRPDALIAQVSVGVVLDDEDPGVLRDLQQPLAPLRRQREAGWVVEVGDGVDGLRRPAVRLDSGELPLQDVQAHTLLVEGDRHDVCAEGLERTQRPRECGRLDEHGITPSDEGPAYKGDGL